MNLKNAIVMISLIVMSYVSWGQTIASEFSAIKIQDFSLANCKGGKTSLSGFEDAKGFVIVFTCNHCPFAKLYSKRLNHLQDKYSKKGYPLLAINSMDSILYREEGLDSMRVFAITEDFHFDYLQDGTQAVGKMFGTKHTPQAFVIQREEDGWVVRYSGAIDSNGEHPNKAKPYIENAIKDLLKGKMVSEPMTSTYGCKIFYRKE